MNTIRFLLLAGVSCLLSACGSVYFHEAKSGPICTEFCVDLPGDFAATAKIGGDENCAFLDVIDQSPGKRWYSIEWCKRKNLQLDSEDDFFKKWDGHEQGYLSSDFAKASYSLVYSGHIRLSDGRPAVAFVGTGRHNGGKPGSVIVVAAQREGYSAVSYLLLDRVISSRDATADSEDYKALVAFADTVRAKEANMRAGK